MFPFPERSLVRIYRERERGRERERERERERGYAMLFVFTGIESSVLFVGLLYISFIIDCE